MNKTMKDLQKGTIGKPCCSTMISYDGNTYETWACNHDSNECKRGHKESAKVNEALLNN